jgi:hypothetical protein
MTPTVETARTGHKAQSPAFARGVSPAPDDYRNATPEAGEREQREISGYGIREGRDSVEMTRPVASERVVLSQAEQSAKGAADVAEGAPGMGVEACEVAVGIAEEIDDVVPVMVVRHRATR